MANLDFSDYTFRCHALGKLMAGCSRIGLTDKQEEKLAYLCSKLDSGKALTPNQEKELRELEIKRDAPPTLSTGAKTYLKKLHIEVLFDRTKEIQSKFLDKGINAEEHSLTLASNVFGRFFGKNKQRFFNEWIEGEPDNTQGIIRDIKTSWDYSTFPFHEETLPNSDYDWQMQGYMDLTGLPKAEVIYCLVDTPYDLIEDEKRKASWKVGMLDLPDELVEEIERNLTYSDIPEEMRIRIFEVPRDEEKIKAIHTYVELAREYLNELSEKTADRLDKIRKLKEAA